MRGSLTDCTALIAPATVSRREGIAFALLGLALIGAVVPVGPLLPRADRVAIPYRTVSAEVASCTILDRARPFGACAAPMDQVAEIAPAAALRMAAIFLP